MNYAGNNLEEMNTVGHQIARTLCGGSVVTLEGNLGAGKTTLVKAIALALGIQEDVISPSFGLMHIYDVNEHDTISKLVHIDTYRIKNSDELIEIGLEDYLNNPKTLTIIEWPELAMPILEKKSLINIVLSDNNGIRTISVTPPVK